MQVTGEFLFQAGQEQVWRLLNDPEVLARCLPGCERLEPVETDRYTATVKVGLAAVKGTYTGHLAVTDKQEPESMTMRIDMSGTTGFVAVTGAMELLPGAGETRVRYDWEVQVGGPVAMVGQRVLGGVARWIIGEFFGTAQKELVVR